MDIGAKIIVVCVDRYHCDYFKSNDVGLAIFCDHSNIVPTTNISMCTCKELLFSIGIEVADKDRE